MKLKLALHTVSYSGTWGGMALPIEEVLDRAVRFGYDAVELMAKRPHVSPLDYDAEDRQSLKEMIASKGLEIACMAGYQDFAWDGRHGDMAHHEKELLWLRETIRLSSDLGCPMVRTFSGYQHPEVPYPQQWKWCVQYLQEAAGFAQEFGVTLLLQAHQGITPHHRQVLAMVKEIGSPNVKIQLDEPYVRKTGVDYETALREVGDLLFYSVAGQHRVQTVPLYARSKLSSGGAYFEMHESWAVPIDEGDGDYFAFLKALQEIGYDGYFGYEICSPTLGGGSLEELDDMAQRAVKHLRGILEKLTQ